MPNTAPSWTERAGRLITAIEHRTLDAISATTPWLAPILPAYMVFDSVERQLGLPFPVAAASGVVVEFLGLSAVHTTFQLWAWNQNAAKTNQAPVRLAALTGAFYLGVVLTVNVILDWGRVPDSHILAKALLSTISIVAAIVLAIRAQHSRRLADVGALKAERQRKRSGGKTDTQPESDDAPEREPWPSDWRRLTETQRATLRGLSASEIKEITGVTDRVSRLWRQRTNGEPVHTNGVAH